MIRISHFLKSVLALLVMCALTTVGAGVASAAPVSSVPATIQVPQAESARSSAVLAHATARALPTVSGECKNGRCVVRLSHTETKLMGLGKLFKVPGWVPVVLRVPLTVSAKAHAYFAKKYASWGLCSQFVLDIRPWVSQGYMSRRC